jgi:GNAT superfamily N-acetyltransferase
LNVVEEFQNCGIGRALIEESERLVSDRGIQKIGIGAGLTPDYAAAQHLYPKLGYSLDGRGVRWTQFGEAMYFIKDLLL